MENTIYDVRVFLIDPYQMFRDVMRAYFQAQPALRLVGEACRASDALPALDDARPDVVMLEVGSSWCDGVDAIAEVLARAPGVKVLATAGHSDPATIRRAVEAGASGWVAKTESCAALVRALRVIARGATWLPDEIALDPEDDAAGYAPTAIGADESLLAGLTRREREVFRRLVQGQNNREIVRDCHISLKTVETHRTRILRKLAVHDLASLVRLAARHRFI